MQIFGKRLVSDQKMIAYHRFPNSDDIEVIPPGQPSGKIDSYLAQGFFVLKGDRFGEYYVKDTNQVKVVDSDTPDRSSLYQRAESAFAGLFSNLGSDISSYSGYLSEGFQKSVAELKIDAFNLGKYMRQVALIIIVILSLWIVNKLV